MLTEEQKTKKHEYYLRNRDKFIARACAYQKQFPERVRAAELKRRENPQYAQKQQQRAKNYCLAHRQELKERHRAYYKAHADEWRIKGKEYRLAHVDEIRERDKAYRERTYDKDVAAEKQRRYRNGHRERVREHCREFYHSNLDKMSLYNSRKNHKRRARENNTECTLTLAEWNKILESQHNKCADCSIEFTRMDRHTKPTKDHIIPVTKGGGLTANNIRALCLSCNSKKFNHILATTQ